MKTIMTAFIILTAAQSSASAQPGAPAKAPASTNTPKPLKSDAGSASLDLACASAGSGTLLVTRAWNSLSTANYRCSLQFANGGMLQPAPGQTVSLSGSIAAGGFQIFDLSKGAGLLIPGATILDARWFGIKGDNQTNNSTAIQSAVTVAMNSAKQLHFPAGIYLTCDSTFTGSGPVTLSGDGMHKSVFNRHPSCLQSHANMFTIVTTGDITVHDLGFDAMTSSKTSFTSNDIDIGSGTTLAASVNFSNNYVAHGQIAGLQCQPCQNLTLTGNTFYQNVWIGASIASAGTTAAPVYNYNFVSHGNTFTSNPFGLEWNFFLSNIVETRDVFDKSTLSIMQMPNARASISELSFTGTPDFGCIIRGAYYQKVCGDLASVYSPIYMEGVSDVDIGNVKITDVTGTAGGILCQGSYIRIPENGKVTQLPCNRVSVHNTTIENVRGMAIGLGSSSTDGTPGTGNTIRSNHVKNVTGGAPAFAMAGTNWDVSDNELDTAETFGFALTGQNGSFRSNKGHNLSTAAPGHYYGVLINQPSSRNIDVFDNEMTDDPGHSMSYCYQDDTLKSGNPSQIRHWGNKCTNGTFWVPAPAIPTLGTWQPGALIENGPSTKSGASGWVNYSAGAPGLWQPVSPQK